MMVAISVFSLNFARTVDIAEVGCQLMTGHQTPHTEMCLCLSERSSRIREITTTESSFTGWRARWCYRDTGAYGLLLSRFSDDAI